MQMIFRPAHQISVSTIATMIAAHIVREIQLRCSTLPTISPTEHFVAWITSADVEKCSVTVLVGQASFDQTCFYSRSLAAEMLLAGRRSDQFRDAPDAPRDRSNPLTRWIVSRPTPPMSARQFPGVRDRRCCASAGAGSSE